ncbi:Hypothetical predicted protein [Pelobates cultripes]|uniref:Endonuclease/exonuclease/phosphatase domain-containing protein n=1 Tax=Pelobates cultripes TaxID=61616 RepID=A0AAD1W4N2_PELCU|nr:Hypothetical predicted protein [Pelobates cultripes]
MGRFLFIKGSIAECTYTFACVYAPNIHQRKFLRQTLTKLERFREGFLIMAGDLNVALEPGTDTSRGVSAFSPHGLRSIRNGLRDAGLVDAWRVLHPCDTDFTYYSTVHKRYSRLDYVFLAQELLPMLLSADIRPMGWSDHSPASVRIRSPLFRPTGRQWRMNESMLTDVPIAADIRTLCFPGYDILAAFNRMLGIARNNYKSPLLQNLTGQQGPPPLHLYSAAMQLGFSVQRLYTVRQPARQNRPMGNFTVYWRINFLNYTQVEMMPRRNAKTVL